MELQRLFPITKRISTRGSSWFRRHFFICLALMLSALGVNELYLFGTDVATWDLMLISGGITFVVGLRLALNIPLKLQETLARLVNRGSLPLTPQQVADLQGELEANADTWAQWGGVVAAASMLIAFLVAFRVRIVDQLLLAVLEVLGAYIAGRFLGRAASYGGLGALISKHQLPVKVQPGHLDGAAGLKPVGDLCFFQAMVVAIPAAYLASWWFIIPLMDRYARWREPYLGLLTLVLIFEVLAFVVPMVSFHQAMQAQKVTFLVEADAISQEVARVQGQLVAATQEDERDELKDRLAQLTARYWALEHMPTWPVDPKLRRQFTINNLALFLPLLSHTIRISGVAEKVLEEIQQILRNLPQ